MGDRCELKKCARIKIYKKLTSCFRGKSAEKIAFLRASKGAGMGLSVTELPSSCGGAVPVLD